MRLHMTRLGLPKLSSAAGAMLSRLVVRPIGRTPPQALQVVCCKGTYYTCVSEPVLTFPLDLASNYPSALLIHSDSRAICTALVPVRLSSLLLISLKIRESLPLCLDILPLLCAEVTVPEPLVCIDLLWLMQQLQVCLLQLCPILTCIGHSLIITIVLSSGATNAE